VRPWPPCVHNNLDVIPCPIAPPITNFRGVDGVNLGFIEEFAEITGGPLFNNSLVAALESSAGAVRIYACAESWTTTVSNDTVCSDSVVPRTENFIRTQGLYILFCGRPRGRRERVSP